MRILLVGGGGREHALAWAIAASPLCTTLYCAPGNAGIAQQATCVPVAAEDVDGLVRFAQENAIDFVVVGPEAPLVAGLVGWCGLDNDLCSYFASPTAGSRLFTAASDAYN